MKHSLLLAMVFVWSLCLGNGAGAATLEVGTDKTYSSIHAALQQAQAGDRLEIHAGTYQEGLLLIDKPLELVGIDSPVLDGAGQDQILKITADGVRVQGLSLQHSGQSFIEDKAAIRVENASGCLIANNRIEDSHFGVYLAGVRSCQVANNTIHGRAERESTSANAIHLWKSADIDIRNNNVSGHRDGIYLEFVGQSRVEDNHSHDNLRYGMHFMFSNGNGYYRNRFESNGAGVAVMYTDRIEMVGNTFVNNWGPSSYGLLLKEIRDSEIRDNHFEHNTIALHLESASRLNISGNTLHANGWAAWLFSSSHNTQFQDNSFSSNTFDIATNGTDASDTGNTFTGNYWDKYSGYDLDRDGVGDVPHHPVSLFSRVVERIPASVTLLRSFLVSALDLAERVSPVLTPKTVVDESPRIRPLPISSRLSLNQARRGGADVTH